MTDRKAFWQGHLKHGQVQYRRRPDRLVFLVELHGPETFRGMKLQGRIVEVEIPHELVLIEFATELFEAMKNKGDELPDTMG